MISFGQRLTEAIRSKQTPLMVGLDPRFERLPASIAAGVNPHNPPEIANAFEIFCKEIIDVVADKVAVVKPQFAFFEQLGPTGMEVLQRVVEYAVNRELLVVGDAKRGDIGSTAEAYADAYLNPNSPGIACDALTINPYMGVDTLQPFVDVAMENGRGVFVLVKTSNPGSGAFQDLKAGDSAIYEKVAEEVQTLAFNSCEGQGFGSVGAVVGATYPQQLEQLREQMPNAPILIPGFGAQGGTANDIVGGFNAEGIGALINSSRGIIFAYQASEKAEVSNWQQAVEQATLDSIHAIQNALNSVQS